MALDSLELSLAQGEMLMFFAGARPAPRGDRRTTHALVRRELLALDPGSGRYEITELGQQVADQLDQRRADTAPPGQPARADISRIRVSLVQH